MKLNLLYKTKTLDSVNVGLITVKCLKVCSNHQFMHDGTMPSRLLAAICCKDPMIDYKEFQDISVIDATRIVRMAKRITKNSKCYLPDLYCSECKKKVLIAFDLEKDVERSSVFDSKIEQFGKSIQLKPMMVKDIGEVLVRANSKDASEFIDLVLLSYVEKIDEQKPNIDEMPIDFIQWVNKQIETEVEKLNLLTKQKEKCDCGKEVETEISMLDQEFLFK